MAVPGARALLVATIFVASNILWVPSVSSQAWTPQPRHGTVAVSYNYTDVDDHLFSKNIESKDWCDPSYCDGNRLDAGDINGSTVFMAFDYGIIDRLAVSGGVALVSSTYDGLIPENEIDLDRHTAFQDWSLALRYTALLDPIVVTPFIGYMGPTHDYGVLGHNAVGRRLDVLQIGVNLGRNLAPLVRNGYVHVNYSYSFVEHIADFGMDASALNLEGGYFINRSVGVRLFSQFYWTHDGFDWFNDELFLEQEHVHDQAAEARFLRLGGGASYSFTRWLDVSASYVATLSGENTHDGQGFILSTSYNF